MYPQLTQKAVRERSGRPCSASPIPKVQVTLYTCGELRIFRIGSNREILRLQVSRNGSDLATVAHLDFEKAISEVEQQIDQLQDLARVRGLDVSAELRSLERKLDSLKRDVYRNLTPIERVQVARHPGRPFTLDYLELVFTELPD